MAYYGVDLALSGYGLLRLVPKLHPLRRVDSPETWRIFRHIPGDFIRNFRLITAPELAVEVYSNANIIKSIHEASQK